MRRAGVGAFVHMVAYLSGIGYSDAAAALSLSLVLLFATIGQPLMGVVADRIGSRRALALAFGLFAFSLVMLLAASQIVALGLFVLIFGLIVAGPIVLSPLVVAESLGVKRYGSLMGLVGFPFTLGLAIGPLAAGAIYDLTSLRARVRTVRGDCDPGRGRFSDLRTGGVGRIRATAIPATPASSNFKTHKIALAAGVFPVGEQPSSDFSERES